MKASSMISHPVLMCRLVMRLCASTDTPSPPASTRRSSASSRPRRLCHLKSGVRQTQPHSPTTAEWLMSMKGECGLTAAESLIILICFVFLCLCRRGDDPSEKVRSLTSCCLMKPAVTCRDHLCSHWITLMSPAHQMNLSSGSLSTSLCPSQG